MTRILVFLGAAAGLMYNALWYFPLLMMLAGCASVVYDYRRLHPPIKTLTSLLSKKQSLNLEEGIELPSVHVPVEHRKSGDEVET